MSITDELRAWAKEHLSRSSILAIADRIDAKHEEAIQQALMGEGSVPATDENMAEHGWMRLPVDADGEYIHIGDVMDGTCPSGKHVNGTVNAIGDGVFWLSNVQFSLKPDYMHHHNAPTVEDVLREFGDKYCDVSLGSDAESELFAEYAAKLRLAGDAE